MTGCCFDTPIRPRTRMKANRRNVAVTIPTQLIPQRIFFRTRSRKLLTFARVCTWYSIFYQTVLCHETCPSVYKPSFKKICLMSNLTDCLNDAILFLYSPNSYWIAYDGPSWRWLKYVGVKSISYYCFDLLFSFLLIKDGI